MTPDSRIQTLVQLLRNLDDEALINIMVNLMDDGLLQNDGSEIY